MSARAVLDPLAGSLPQPLLGQDYTRVARSRFRPPQPLTERQVDPSEFEGQALKRELAVARRIQQSLLPKHFPSLPGFELAGFCQSACQVGGDFYDVLPLSSESMLLVIADVMGKGVPAAMFASTLRTLVRTISEWTCDPAQLLARINRLMFEELSSVDMFITIQVAVADARRRSLVLANAGHCPLLFSDGLSAPKALAPEGLPLGIRPDGAFAQETIPLSPFSCALLYTDGLTDARNEKGEVFGQPRLENWLRRNASTNRTAPQLRQQFLAELGRFQSSAAPPDDQTFLLLVHAAEGQHLAE
jgi:sigma-B regulation protein RsbU (phosphoserine phosphatase)